jgi:uncharacterized membrane protein YjfL (UPF0719 family)
MDNSSTTPNKETSPAVSKKADPLATAEIRSTFFAAALSMGWQLAVVVVVPIVGGYYLDQHLDESATWEVVGFVVALLGFVVVVRRQLLDFNEMTKRGGHKK